MHGEYLSKIAQRVIDNLQNLVPSNTEFTINDRVQYHQTVVEVIGRLILVEPLAPDDKIVDAASLLIIRHVLVPSYLKTISIDETQLLKNSRN
jgi:hypothetical protein